MAGGIVVPFAPSASAQGFFESLFGGFGIGQRQAATNAYADPSADLRVRSEPMGGRAFCVRLCDGRYYPITSASKNSTPVEMCGAMCPAAKTRVFQGGEIESAYDSTGARYTKLDQAFTYRKNLVPGCTCNGKDAFGLVPIDVMADPTLQSGDIVATETGLKSFRGVKSEAHTAADFTPARGVSKVSGALRDRISDLRAPEKR